MRGRGNINYIYDAAGNKLSKITADSTVSTVKTTTTVYTSLFVYQNDSLQYIAHEEGRIRPKLISQTGGWVAANLQYLYDYVVKDHLGNERMTLTEETQTDTYAATMETKNAATENALFDSVSSTQYAVPAGFEPTTGADTSNHYVSRLNSNNKRVGPTLLLKVMAGDTLTAASYVWYVGTPQSPGTQPSLLSTLTNLLADNVLGIAGSKFLAGQQSAISTAAGPAFTSLLAAKDAAYSTMAPKAFLNWAFLDERFNYVQGGVTQVPLITAGQSKQIITAALPSVVAKSGYFYVYVSNESPQDVFFDNVTIQHKRGPLLQEDHYYPFGLGMAGISSKAAGGLENKKKFNAGSELQNKEFSDGNGLELYATSLRSLDPQLGRWWQIDSKPDYGQSLYSAMNNNPISFNDPFGDTLNVADIQKNDSRTGAALMADLASKSGLTLQADENGNVSYEKTNGKAIITKDKNGKNIGSKAARKALMKLINSKSTVDVIYRSDLPTSTMMDKNGHYTNAININHSDIEKNIKNTSNDLNSTTFGYALSFFHELGHTLYGGGKDDPPFVKGQSGYEIPGYNETLPNKIRRQLGPSYGQRMTYLQFPATDGQVYFPFSQTSLEQLQNKQTPTEKYILDK